MVRVKKFSFKLSDDDPVEIPDEIEEGGVRRRWMPFHVDANPEFNSLWVWAYMIET